MKNIFRILVLLVTHFLFLPFSNHAQNFVWAKGAGHVGNEAANAVAVDEAGNTYITGNLAGMINFSGTFYQGKGLYDVVLAKYDAAGNLQWVKTAGGKRNDQGNTLKYRNGFLYVGGFFEDTAWFENTMVISKGEADAFVAKYDANGNLIWLTVGGGTELDFISSVDVDANGNVYACGTFEKTMTIDTFQLTTTNIYSESFICKLNASGKVQWTKATKGNNINLLTGIAVSASNDVFVTGFFGGMFSINNQTMYSNSPSYDVLLARLDNNGNLQWIKTAGSNYEDAATAIAVDGEGNPVITGYFAGIATFGSNTITYHDYNDVFVAKYDAAGNNLWVRAGKGQQLDVGYAITVDADNNIFATGVFQGTAVFDGYTVTGIDREIFMVSYSPTGTVRWVQKAGGINTDCGLGIAVKSNGNVVICGYYIHTCYFGNIQIDYADGNDLFVAEYDPPFVSNLPATVADYTYSLYPNPAEDFILVSSDKAKAPYIQVNIFDSRGALVLNQSIQVPTGYLSLQTLSAGFYNVLVTDGQYCKALKLVVK
ncbi:MAG: T9SS type A sorting domain-containing protein [Chitinophagales bacterium]|nr:T9SS type A sorting domain-containing protein [Chitinophagales bacterium]